MSPASTASIEVECTRCQGTRSIPNPYIPLNARGRSTGPARDLREPGGYTCLRCRRVLTGGRVQDPIASPRQIATTVAALAPRRNLQGLEASDHGLR